jgi:hypothetical protein
MNDRFTQVFEEIDLLLLEARRLRALGPTFNIYHRYQQVEGFCTPGEEICLITLSYRAREFMIHLPTGCILLFDYLTRIRLPQSASQIANAMASDNFTIRHPGVARIGQRRRRSSPSRFVIKSYINRTRVALRRTFTEAGLGLAPSAVLVSEMTTANQVLYRLVAQVRVIHVPKGTGRLNLYLQNRLQSETGLIESAP